MCNDDESVRRLSLGSVGLHVMPKLNLPVDFNFAGGIANAPGEIGVGMTGFISMDIFYKLPFCENMFVG